MSENFDELAASMFIKQAQEAEKQGDINKAKSLYGQAAERYRNLANEIPSKRNEFNSLADQYDNKIPATNVPRTPTTPIKIRGGNSGYSGNNPGDTKHKEADNNPHTVDVGLYNQAINELDSLIGLKSVKSRIRTWASTVKLDNERIRRGVKVNTTRSYHMIFSGNPGTGKTTVARLVANIYHSLGILSKGHLVEVTRGDLVAGYVGQTAGKTKSKVDEALGGVLFIDEAYSLAEGGQNDFGLEAITTLLQLMEEHRDNLVVIVAGYKDRMDEFINSNPGLKSRFANNIDFEDYTGPEMLEIFMRFCNCGDKTYILTEEAKEKLSVYLDELYANRTVNFGNGRDVRNLFDDTTAKLSERLDCEYSNLGDITIEQLMTIKAEDLAI
jgi:SpoVK/Ycf46/Vps4 family AAA+-type ATPase